MAVSVRRASHFHRRKFTILPGTSVAVRGDMQHVDTPGIPFETTRLAVLWQSLLEGRLLVIDSYCAGGRCYALLERRSDGQRLSGSGVEILERVFQGESQKSLAYDLGISVATAAAHSATVLRSMQRKQPDSKSAPHHLVSRAPLILVMAAMASRGLPLGDALLDCEQQDGSWLISVPLPGATFRGRLSASEWEVVRLAIEGATYADIAGARTASPRTVANQLAAAFRKLRLSGRGMLRAQAIREMALDTAATTGAPPPTPVVSLSPHAPRVSAALPAWPEPQLAAYG
jgi:DNA-binding CsgD family transcriptional regulator